MEKIGILTYSFGTNYGGTLQCLGLTKVIKNLRKNNEIIVLDYYPKNTYSLKNKYINGIGLKKSIKYLYKNNKSIFRKFFIKIKYVDDLIKKFEKFRNKNMNMTNTSNNLKKLIEEEKDLKYIIVGSDQVWAEVDEYFLSEITSKNIRKISYAACSGKNYSLSLKEETYLKNSLRTFSAISVRNKHTKDFVEKIINKEVKIVCDPSILYDYKEFLSDKKNKEKYILTYILGEDIKEGNINVIEEIKKVYGDIKVIAIGIPFAVSGGLNFYSWADQVIYNATPEEWLNYINNAEFIYTDSYHGALFSMKFHKPFLAYYSEKNRSPRFLDLAQRYNVDKYIVNTLEEAIEKKSICKEVDYTEIDKLIDKHRKYSMEFLTKALED